jgi:hypothetical protein
MTGWHFIFKLNAEGAPMQWNSVSLEILVQRNAFLIPTIQEQNKLEVFLNA